MAEPVTEQLPLKGTIPKGGEKMFATADALRDALNESAKHGFTAADSRVNKSISTLRMPAFLPRVSFRQIRYQTEV
jgi:hypothetical protein